MRGSSLGRRLFAVAALVLIATVSLAGSASAGALKLPHGVTVDHWSYSADPTWNLTGSGTIWDVTANGISVNGYQRADYVAIGYHICGADGVCADSVAQSTLTAISRDTVYPFNLTDAQHWNLSDPPLGQTCTFLPEAVLLDKNGKVVTTTQAVEWPFAGKCAVQAP